MAMVSSQIWSHARLPAATAEEPAAAFQHPPCCIGGEMQAERGHSSIAAPQCRHMQGFQTLLCRPVLPYTRVGSFRILQRCVHDARFSTRRACRLQCSLSTAAPRTEQGVSSNGKADAKQESQLPVSSAYPFTDIEAKWQEFWLRNKTFRTPDLAELDTSKPKAYILDMFPYPSGAGLHVGHPAGYTATDILARLRRMQGCNVLHPIGWDAFGLPAEQYAIQTGTHPRITTEHNINRFRTQLQSLGFSYDWDREVSTTSPEYYKWTQWIFCQLFKRGLAYQAEVPVNWCPALGTVLANEEVIDGKSERGDHPVVRLAMKQWMLRITEYADRLLEDLEDLDWPDSIKDMQRNWIGRSEGATIKFAVQGGEGTSIAADVCLEVFTTRPDTIFGATYMVIAPEHPLLESLASSSQRDAVQEYVAKAAQKSDLERTELQKVKTGVDTGSFAVNPATGAQVPIWVADYVLGSYGSGAIMAVPAHDARDHEFAQQYGLPIVQVVQSPESEEQPQLPFTGKGAAVSSSNEAEGLRLDGLGTEEAAAAVVRWLQEEGRGAAQTNYKLRDWLFARQRYWGEPFPIVFEEGSEEPQAVPESELPLTLPETDNFKPSGSPESPLANISDWVTFTDPQTGKRYKRETSTMPQWAGSCWYYLRYLQPWNTERPVDPEVEQYWLPVDLYVGGAEHAVLHLLYARFWHKVLYDIGLVSRKEPFQSLVSQGMILGEVEYTVYRDQEGNIVDEERPSASATRVDEADVEKRGNGYVLRSDPSVRVSSRAHKMSKSRGNVVNPDDVVTMYGADSLRLYEMFMGPLRDTKVWSTNQVEGVHRFLARSYRLVTGDSVTEDEPTKDQVRFLHIAVKRVTEETEQMRFNTGISALMEFVNAAYKWDTVPKGVLLPFVLLLAPYAPHLAEELWQVLGHSDTLAYEAWPSYNEKLLVSDTFNLPIQVNGKLRGTVEVAKDIAQEEAVAVAWEQESVAKFLSGKELKKIIFVPGRILNVIVSK